MNDYGTHKMMEDALGFAILPFDSKHDLVQSEDAKTLSCTCGAVISINPLAVSGELNSAWREDFRKHDEHKRSLR